MLSKVNVTKILLCILALIFSAFSQVSYADWGIGVSVGGPGYHHDDHRFYRWHDRPHYGYHVHFLPGGYYTIWVGGQRYYYYDGLYYAYAGYGDYILVNPPVGAYVSAIPPDFQAVNINGRIYYTDGGVYYVLTQHHGYKVVPQPVVYSQPVQVVEAEPQQVTTVVTTQSPAPVVEAQDTFPVNVPNNSGGYTAVLIKKSGNGYVGPQGEFYSAFPTIAQLKAMYGK